MRLLHIRAVELETYRGIFTFGVMDVLDFPCKIDHSIQTTPNSELRKIVDKMKSLAYEQELKRRAMDR